jgi:tetratricopeptide (TPR) repeat protein
VPITALSGALEKIREGQTPPERQKIALEISQTLFKEGKKDIAVALLERVTGENPSWTDALFLLSAEYRKSSQLDASSGALLRILQVEPANALAYNNLGMIQMRKQKPKDAIPYLERSFAIDKKAPEVALNLGIAYEQTLIWGKSVQAYDHYLGLVHPKGGLSNDKVINAVKFRMERLKAFARAQGTLEPKAQVETQIAIQSHDEEHEEGLPLATGPAVDPNPIQTAKDSGAPATVVQERAPASLPSQLPTQLKKGASP